MAQNNPLTWAWSLVDWGAVEPIREIQPVGETKTNVFPVKGVNDNQTHINPNTPTPTTTPTPTPTPVIDAWAWWTTTPTPTPTVWMDTPIETIGWEEIPFEGLPEVESKALTAAEQLELQWQKAATEIEWLKDKELWTLEEQKKSTEEQIKATADLKEDILNDTRNLFTDQVGDRITSLETQQTEQVDYLKSSADLAKEVQAQDKKKLEAAAELQRIKDERAIVQANAQIELDKQKSAWAYNKLWLGMSSWIINESQRIATDWIAKITEIKAQMNYNERLLDVETAKINLEMEQIQLDYNNQISSTINKYSNRIDDMEDSVETQILDTQNNLLLNADEKDAKITELLNQYRTDKDWLERQHIDDMLWIKEKWLEYAKEVEVQLEKKKVKDLENLSQAVVNWRTASMTQEEIYTEEDRLGLPRWTIYQKQTEMVMGNMREFVDNTIWKDFIINNPDFIQVEAEKLMKQWQTLEQATRTATANYVKNTTEYKSMSKLKQAQINDWIAKAQWTGRYAPQTSWMESLLNSMSSWTATNEDYGNMNKMLNNIIEADLWISQTQLQKMIDNWETWRIKDLWLRANETLKNEAITWWEAPISLVKERFDFSALTRDIKAAQDFTASFAIDSPVDLVAQDYFKDDIVNRTTDLVNQMKDANVSDSDKETYFRWIIKEWDFNKWEQWIYIEDWKLKVNELWFDDVIYDFNEEK